MKKNEKIPEVPSSAHTHTHTHALQSKVISHKFWSTHLLSQNGNCYVIFQYIVLMFPYVEQDANSLMLWQGTPNISMENGKYVLQFARKRVKVSSVENAQIAWMWIHTQNLNSMRNDLLFILLTKCYTGYVLFWLLRNKHKVTVSSFSFPSYSQWPD